MKSNKTDEFEGFDFTTPSENIISGKSDKILVYDDGTGLTGDFSEVDTYFNDEMIKSDKEIDNILRSI